MTPLLPAPTVARPVKRYRIIACELFRHEVRRALEGAPDIVDLEFLPEELHDADSAETACRVQRIIDDAEGSPGAKTRPYDGLLLGYGLCSKRVVGVEARSIPLVLMRAQDCTTVFLGERFPNEELFRKAPGAYHLAQGWIDPGEEVFDAVDEALFAEDPTGSFEDHLAYGEEGARHIMEILGAVLGNHADRSRIDFWEDDQRVSAADTMAEEPGWSFRTIPGQWSLLIGLITGAWDPQRFLVVPPGCRITTRYGGEIMTTEPVPSTARR